MYRMIPIRCLTLIYTTRSRVSSCMACVFASVHIKAWNKGISMQIDRRKDAAYLTVFDGLHGNQFDASDLMRGKKNLWKILNMWHAVSRYQHDGTHGSGEGRKGPAMWPPGYELQEGGSLTRHWIENTRRWDRKTRLTSMIYWSVGCCTYLLKKVCLKRAQNIAIHKLDSSTEARIKRWIKQFQQDVSGSSMVTESLKSLSSGIPARRVSVTTVFYIA